MLLLNYFKQSDFTALDKDPDSMDTSLSKLRDSEGQGNMVYYSSWGCKESDMTQ